MGRTNLAATLDGTKHRMLVRTAASDENALLAADERLVGLNGLALATQRRERAIGHCRADAVRHEPRRLVGHAEHAVELVRAETLLGARQQTDGLHPLVQLDVAALKESADRYRERLPAMA